MKKRIIQIANKPSLLFMTFGHRGLLNWMSDKRYLEISYSIKLGKKLDLKSPKTFNEKLQWLKLYDRNPIYTRMVDKIEAKSIVAELLGDELIIPTLGIWERFEDIDFEKLPQQFVLKCSHDSGGLVICTDKSTFDINAAKRKINNCLRHNFFWAGREWPYKNVKPRIIAEKYMEDESGYELKDYKIYNFMGKPKLIQVDYDRFIDHKRNFYSPEWEIINAELIYPCNTNKIIEKPVKLNEMLEFAAILSSTIPFLRTDFYSINDKVYFGEMTFFPESGFGIFKPERFDTQLGEWLKLP